MRFERYGIWGSLSVTEPTRSRKASKMGSIMREWKACEVRTGRVLIPWRASIAFKSAMSWSGPETTHRPGPLTAARSTSSGSIGSSSSSGSITASMEPAGIACISAPRSATRRKASYGSITPARLAATYSPTLCPAMAAGSTP